MVIRHFNVGETLRKNSKERHCGRDRTDRSARRLRNAYGPAAKEDIDKWDPLARDNFLNATKGNYSTCLCMCCVECVILLGELEKKGVMARGPGANPTPHPHHPK